ncbi:MAG: tripartite tricarboxylate transporter TctB family protein [Acidimicrobiia bacterium]|nr:tripartite tricarboxylate transporter TctB family protein [Acidimicrobiia bacterium]
MNRDLWLGVIGLVLAGAYYLMAADVPESLLSDAVGPAGLPKIYAYVLAGLSLVLAGRGFAPRLADRPPRAESRGKGPPYVRREIARAAGLLALGAVYLAVVEFVGYVVAVALLIAATVWYQGGVFRPRILLVAACGAALFWLMFVRLLGVQHPPGIWESLL